MSTSPVAPIRTGSSARRRVLFWAGLVVLLVLIVVGSDALVSYMMDRLLKEDSPIGWAEAQHQKARELSTRGKYRRAADILRPVIELRTRVLGPEHSDTLKSRNNLANALGDMGERTDAMKEYRAVLTIRERVLGPEHPDTLSSRSNVASTLDEMGQHAEGEKEHRAVLAIRGRVLGPEHAKTLDSRMNLASVLCCQNMFAESETEYWATLAVLERLRKPDDEDISLCCYGLGFCLDMLGRKPEALVFARRSLEGRKKKLGRWHRDTQDAIILVDYIENDQSTQLSWLDNILRRLKQN